MSNPKQPSLVGRAILAVALMIGFYALALGIIAGLLFVVYAQVRIAHRISVKLTGACLIGAGVIGLAILPRRDKFAAPGPALEPKKHPKLFQELGLIAKATGQPVPEEAYLEMDVNAWVSQRGGFMGFGGRRIMGIGLPLLRILKVSQLRGVLGHEFGHYHGGDTKLGPWIYKTHEALFRTVHSLGESGSVLSHVFIAYAKMFLRITNAISRRQELAADQLAAGIVGSRAFGEGLRAVHEGGMVYQTYMRSECIPAFSSGFRPPLADGFARFLGSKTISKAVGEAVDREKAEGTHDPYRTHPPLHERLEAVASLPAGPKAGSPALPAGDPPAVSLVEDLDALEDQLLRLVFNENAVAKLKPLKWEDVGAQVYVPMWTKLVADNAGKLHGLTASQLPDKQADLERVGRALMEGPTGKDDAVAQGGFFFGAALTTALVRGGWTLSAEPGEAVTVSQGGAVLTPFSLFSDLRDGKLTPEQWRSTCASAGIADLSLAPPG